MLVGTLNKEKALVGAFSGHCETSGMFVDSSSGCTWCRTPPWWRSSSPARTSSWLLISSGLLVTPVTSPAECCGGTAPASCPWPPATRLHLLQSRHTWHKSEVSKNIFNPAKYFWSNKIFLITSKYLSFSNLAHSSANVYLNTWYFQANKIHIWFKF